MHCEATPLDRLQCNRNVLMNFVHNMTRVFVLVSISTCFIALLFTNCLVVLFSVHTTSVYDIATITGWQWNDFRQNGGLPRQRGCPSLVTTTPPSSVTSLSRKFTLNLTSFTACCGRRSSLSSAALYSCAWKLVASGWLVADDRPMPYHCYCHHR